MQSHTHTRRNGRQEEAGRSTENLSVAGGDTHLMSGTDVHLLASPSAAGLLHGSPVMNTDIWHILTHSHVQVLRFKSNFPLWQNFN